jgi:quercetin dioxygenase-like cupin family protein
MVFADWIAQFTQVEVWDGLNANVLTGKAGQVGFFRATGDILVPEHSHAGQWGVVIEGTVELTIDGKLCILKTGEHYNIPAGVPHSAKVLAGTSFIDVWEGKRLEVNE